MRDWFARLTQQTSRARVVMVSVIATDGSTPRDVGARMLVHEGGIDGSIGGGTLEYAETTRARRLISNPQAGPWHRERHRITLGPDAGQCCGGVVEVLHEVLGPDEHSALVALQSAQILARTLDPGSPMIAAGADTHAGSLSEPLTPSNQRVTIYGGGHVAAALAAVLKPLPFETRLLVARDTVADPAFIHPAGTSIEIVDDVVSAVTSQPPHGIHLVMTHSHDLDYALCEALLARDDVAFLGLIGSATKRARFAQRLKRNGTAHDIVARLVCPIGLEAVRGKAPETIAISVAAQLLSRFHSN